MTTLLFGNNGALLGRARLALHESQTDFGARFGVSKRTIIRWEAAASVPFDLATVRALAQAVYPRDPEVASEIAAEAGHTLASFGIAPAVAPSPERMDRVVLAAAEAADVSPVTIRRALTAALDRATSLGLSLDEMRATLAPRDARRRAR
jgi:transcriptional regulator with XRE-family HTH domain